MIKKESANTECSSLIKHDKQYNLQHEDSEWFQGNFGTQTLYHGS